MDRRDTENLKAEIIAAVQNCPLPPNATGVTIEQVYEEPRRVFDGYTIDETQNQFMYQPFAAFRFDGELTVSIPCEL